MVLSIQVQKSDVGKEDGGRCWETWGVKYPGMLVASCVMRNTLRDTEE